MGCSGWLLSTTILIFISTLFSYVSLITPLWILNTSVDSGYKGVITKADSSFGVWALCIDLQFDPKTTVVAATQSRGKKKSTKAVHGNTVGTAYNSNECYPYYMGQTRNYFSFAGSLTKVSYDKSLCSYFNDDEGVASRALGLMTGFKEKDIKEYLQKQCGGVGKATYGLAVSMSIVLTLSFILLLMISCCCKENNAMLIAIRVFIFLGMVFSGVLNFTAMSQYRPIHGENNSVYHASIYLEWISFFFALFASLTVEKYVKTLQSKEVKSDLI